MERHRLELLGITYNQIESGVYAVILKEVGGERRIPIIIGYPEAQAIECKLQEVVTPRPLTHDMMINCLDRFGISIRQIEIRKLPSGVFAADIYLFDGEKTKVIDARSSDAIALAIRADAPIYTSSEVLDECGFDPTSTESALEKDPQQNTADNLLKAQANQLRQAPRTSSRPSIENLKEQMQKAAENEDYEEAARLKAEIDRLSGQEKNED